jgi:hypothetical protein
MKAAAVAVGVVALVVPAWLLVPAGAWLRVGAGVVIILVALVVAWWVRRLVGRSPETERQAIGILTGAGARTALTESMVLEVDQVVAKLKGLDAKFLGLTMVMLIREAEEAKESADRVAALVQMVTLMEKLTRQLSPGTCATRRRSPSPSPSSGRSPGWRVSSAASYADDATARGTWTRCSSCNASVQCAARSAGDGAPSGARTVRVARSP